jgi:hypothetical protein
MCDCRIPQMSKPHCGVSGKVDGILLYKMLAY